MADVFTDTTQLSNLVQAAYDRAIEFALRSVPQFRGFVTKRPVQQAMPGSSVVFELYNDLTAATSTLSEDVDVAAVGVPQTTTVSVTLSPYGNAVITSENLRLEALSDVEPAVANIVAWNMVDSIDAVIQNIIAANGTNIAAAQAGGFHSTQIDGTAAAKNSVTQTDVFTSTAARAIPAVMRTNKALPAVGDYYRALVHPKVSVDLRSETGAAGWRDPHAYSGDNAGAIWKGELGAYEGAAYVETPRNTVVANGTSINVYNSYFLGQQALAEAVAEEPHIVFGLRTDKLMRFQPVGWKSLIGWNVFRQAALFQVYSASSLH